MLNFLKMRMINYDDVLEIKNCSPKTSMIGFEK